MTRRLVLAAAVCGGLAVARPTHFEAEVAPDFWSAADLARLDLTADQMKAIEAVQARHAGPADDHRRRINRSQIELDRVLAALSRERWAVLTEAQRGKLADAGTPRFKLSLDAALLGRWDRLHGHGRHEFRADGRVDLRDEGVTVEGRWKLIGRDDRERVLRLNIDWFNGGGGELVLRLAQDGNSLMASGVGDRPVPVTWVFAGGVP